MKCILSLSTLAFCLLIRSALADEIKGAVLLKSSGCPISNLLVEVDPQIGSKEPKVITTTTQNGTFSAHVTSGRYLIVFYQQSNKVFQQEIQVRGILNLPIALSGSAPAGSAPCINHDSGPAGLQDRTAPADGKLIHFSVVDHHDYGPVDLALDDDGSFLVLQEHNKVIELSRTWQNRDLFLIPNSDKLVAVASNADYVFATSNRFDGCVLWLYDKEKQVALPHLFGLKSCSGIAVDDHNLYLMFDGYAQIQLWTDLSFGKSTYIFPPFIEGSAKMAVDSRTHELFIGDSSGQLYRLPPGDKHPHLLTNTLNGITSIGIGSRHLIVTSGNTWACFDRERSRVVGHNSCLDASPHGNFAGVRVDNEENAWFLDKSNRELIGPYPVH